LVSPFALLQRRLNDPTYGLTLPSAFFAKYAEARPAANSANAAIFWDD
jgi:hypothetical protein